MKPDFKKGDVIVYVDGCGWGKRPWIANYEPEPLNIHNMQYYDWNYGYADASKM